jgi:uncharacterized protein (DUF1684 family)
MVIRTFLLFLLGLPLLLPAQSETYLTLLEKHREDYVYNLTQGPRAPLDSTQLDGVRFFPGDSLYRVMAAFTPTPDAEPFDLATYSGITKPYVQYGWLDFELKGDSLRLAVYQSLRLRQNPIYKDHLFLPFKDHTCGETSYGGGRYLDLKIQEIQNGVLPLDFNKAYNPWCAFSDGYNCPIPPNENHLDISIPAGEQMYQKMKK